MPHCTVCGNEEEFNHRVRGHETRIYDERGTVKDASVQDLKSMGVRCGDCGSQNVIFDAITAPAD